MALIDPSAYDGDGSVAGPEDETLSEPGTYLLAFAYFHEIRTSQKGNRFARFKAQVIDGPKAGQVFWLSVFLGERSYPRLQAMCKAMGHFDPWDPEDDEQVKTVLLGRPFAADVSVKRNGKYLDHDLKRFYFSLKAETQAKADQWVSDWLEAEDRRAAAEADNSEWDDDAPMPDVDGDDIPF